jgi:hypothetical protein
MTSDITVRNAIIGKAVGAIRFASIASKKTLASPNIPMAKNKPLRRQNDLALEAAVMGGIVSRAGFSGCLAFLDM